MNPQPPKKQEKQEGFHGAIVDKNPTRMAIHGITDTVSGLKSTIEGMDMHEGLKSFIQDELEKIGETGAEIHLHDIETISNGSVTGFNLHLQIAGKSIGAKPHMIFKRAG